MTFSGYCSGGVTHPIVGGSIPWRSNLADAPIALIPRPWEVAMVAYAGF